MTTNRNLRSCDSDRGHGGDNRGLGGWRRCRNDAGRAGYVDSRFLGSGRVIRLGLHRVCRLGVERRRAVRLRHRLLRIGNNGSEGQSRQQVPQRLAV